MGVKILLRQYDTPCTMSFDCIRFMTLNKLLRKWRNIAEKRRYTYKTTRILASNNPGELDFVSDNSYDNALYTFNLIDDHMNVCFMHFHENHKICKQLRKIKGVFQQNHLFISCKHPQIIQNCIK